jgi:hypothetical protein
MLKRLAAYTLFAFGLITVVFFRHYTGNLIPYPWIFFVIGFGMFLGGYFLLRYSAPATSKVELVKFRQLIDHLKTNGDRIPVDLNSCDIRSHDYREPKAAHGADNLLVDLTVSSEFRALMNHLDDPGGTGMQNVQQSVIVFSHANPKTGTTERFLSPIIAKDKITLSFYLDRQKQTTLYVDKSNRSLYYFDLDFLKS